MRTTCLALAVATAITATAVTSARADDDPRQARGPRRENQLVAIVQLDPDPAPTPPPEPEEPPEPVTGLIEVHHLLEDVDLSEATLDTDVQGSDRGFVGPATDERARDLGLGTVRFGGIGVGVVLRPLRWLQLTIFGFDLLFGGGGSGWHEVATDAQLHLDSSVLVRMYTAPGVRLPIGPIALFAHGRLAAMVGDFFATSRDVATGARADGRLSDIHWELGYDAGLAVSLGVLEVGIAWHHHPVGAPAIGVSALASFRFVRAAPRR